MEDYLVLAEQLAQLTQSLLNSSGDLLTQENDQQCNMLCGEIDTITAAMSKLLKQIKTQKILADPYELFGIQRTQPVITKNGIPIINKPKPVISSKSPTKIPVIDKQFKDVGNVPTRIPIVNKSSGLTLRIISSK